MPQDISISIRPVRRVGRLAWAFWAGVGAALASFLSFNPPAAKADRPQSPETPQAAQAPAGPGEEDQRVFAERVLPFLATHCADCHSGDEAEAGLDVTSFRNVTEVLQSRRRWKSIAEMLHTREMPPADYARPPLDETDFVADWIDAELARYTCTGPRDPGRVTIRRLNRAEYNNTIRDLLGVDFQPADDFPADDVGYGFDNIGDVLSVPPLLLEKYLAAAEQVLQRAIVVDDPRLSSTPVTRISAADMSAPPGSELVRRSGRLLLTNGALESTFSAPHAGDYLLSIRAWGDHAGNQPPRMALELDGQPVRTFDIRPDHSDPRMAGTYEVRQRLEAGRRRFSVAFVNDYYNPDHEDPAQRDRNLGVYYLEISGPLGLEHRKLPESHLRIFGGPTVSGDKRQAARRILSDFAQRAFRRPVTEREIQRLMRIWDAVDGQGEPFERAVQVALTAVLVSPHFLFRVELDPDPNNPEAIRRLNDWELASRLSYFLWSSMPDDDLFKLAAAGHLRDRAVLARQVRRMLQDPKAQALVDNFAGQWLQVRRLESVTPDRQKFPEFDEALRAAMLEETRQFFAAVMTEDRSILEFLDADYTFVNQRLAEHYGIKGVWGHRFRRVTLSDRNRGGVLTQAAVLTITSHPTRTSPVNRGKWVLENLLGTPPPPAPPDVPDLSETKTIDQHASLRQRLEQHRANPACAACHRRLDPLGFGLENFDAIGRWRSHDGQAPVDASGTLPGGKSFAGPAGLKAVLMSKRDLFARCLTEKMLTYALGRGLEEYDDCTVDEIAEAVRCGDYRFSSLVEGIVTSYPFQFKRGAGVQP